jgi:hypothetical protein
LQLVLHRKLLSKRPILEMELNTNENTLSLSHRFVALQYSLMANDKLSEDKAFETAEQTLKEEIAELEKAASFYGYDKSSVSREKIIQLFYWRCTFWTFLLAFLILTLLLLPLQ